MNDAEAMDRLAHRFKSALGEGVNGGDLVELVGDLLKATGRSQDYTLATVANMRKFAEENPAPADNVERPRCIALSLVDGEEASGDAGDYFAVMDENIPLRWEGEPMILVRRSRGHVDALTGEAI